MGTVSVKTWSELTSTEVYAIARLRTEVFLREQRCDDEELDWRDLEPGTEHYLLQDAGDAAVASYLRVLRQEVPGDVDAPLIIGRVCTDPDHRGKGLASRLLAEVIARHGGEPMLLHAQLYATGLYANAGFSPVGEQFEEAGISHIAMVRPAD
ncbi:GNAT family N-acetyltransferase [Corynebacterium terpenotabidum]|uniref:N-acetyltransferase domain-containing protein n=1 Tax=Corynebacterium terpenotabidum Y-11 TaxID=1200352 RepID=S4XA34_9CORY|nr:GNAT family N-acetyltransferase [Corynebacterium terpenotabidum]AGP29967.1 hypothetical protein A606_01560 [Corynebacterium terpenotabidum Y-11]